jgi:hypothetical protein
MAAHVSAEKENHTITSQPDPPTTSFYSLETSAAIIKVSFCCAFNLWVSLHVLANDNLQRARGRIPINWKGLTENEARDFIRKPPLRDKRKNMEKLRFRLLVVENSHLGELYRQSELLQVARSHGWIGNRFDFFIKNATAGSAVIESSQSTSKLNGVTS